MKELQFMFQLQEGREWGSGREGEKEEGTGCKGEWRGERGEGQRRWAGEKERVGWRRWKRGYQPAERRNH
jgi:hypothetical protein